MAYMNTVRRGMFGDSNKSGGKVMKKVGIGAAKAVGNFFVTAQDGFKEINKQKKYR